MITKVTSSTPTISRLTADEMVFKRIRVPGEEAVDVASLLSGTGRSNWRDSVKG